MATQHEAGLVICVTGPESTGKTTLANALAVALGAPLVAEVARSWLMARLVREPGAHSPAAVPARPDSSPLYGPEDLLAIARAQLAAERAAVSSGVPLVVADTDLTVIQVWWQEKYGELDPWLAGALAARSARRYLLALPDLPWEPDPLRESPLDRERLLGRYRELLGAGAFPHAEVGGTGHERFERALAIVRRWLAEAPDPKPRSTDW